MAAAPRPGSGTPGRIVVLGASAGGVEALVRLVGHLPERLGCAVLVVLHVAPAGTSVLPQILARACDLPVSGAVDGDALAADHVYVAVPDRHLGLAGDHMVLARTPREHGHRPAIDVTMRAAAGAFGPGAVGVILSGMRDDGTAGLLAIKAAGGEVAAQDPVEALHGGMPSSAARHVVLDAILPADRLGAWIGRTVAVGAFQQTTLSKEVE